MTAIRIESAMYLLAPAQESDGNAVGVEIRFTSDADDLGSGYLALCVAIRLGAKTFDPWKDSRLVFSAKRRGHDEQRETPDGVGLCADLVDVKAAWLDLGGQKIAATEFRKVQDEESGDVVQLEAAVPLEHSAAYLLLHGLAEGALPRIGIEFKAGTEARVFELERPVNAELAAVILARLVAWQAGRR